MFHKDRFMLAGALVIVLLAGVGNGVAGAEEPEFHHVGSRAFTVSPPPPVILYQQTFSRVHTLSPRPHVPQFSNVVSRAFTVELCTVLGDLNCDGVVNVFDLFDLLGAWGPCENPVNCPADLDGNGTVNVFDLFILLGNWG